MKLMLFFAILGFVGIAQTLAQTSCSYWDFKNCVDRIEKDFAELYKQYDKCQKVQSQTEALSACRWRHMDGCKSKTHEVKNPGEGRPYPYATTPPAESMDAMYANMLNRIRNEERTHCDGQGKKKDPNYPDRAYPEENICHTENYFNCVRKVEEETNKLPMGPSDHTCEQLKQRTQEYRTCGAYYKDACRSETHSEELKEMKRVGQDTLELVSERERDACSGNGRHYNYASGAVRVFRFYEVVGLTALFVLGAVAVH